MSRALFFVFVVSFFSAPVVYATNSALVGSKAALSVRLVSSASYKGRFIQRASFKLVKNTKSPFPNNNKMILRNEDNWTTPPEKSEKFSYQKPGKNTVNYLVSLFKSAELQFEPVFIPDELKPFQFYSSIIRPSVIQIE